MVEGATGVCAEVLAGLGSMRAEKVTMQAIAPAYTARTWLIQTSAARLRKYGVSWPIIIISYLLHSPPPVTCFAATNLD